MCGGTLAEDFTPGARHAQPGQQYVVQERAPSEFGILRRMSGRAPALSSVRRGSLVLLVQAASDPTMAEWDTFLDTTSRAMAEHGGRCRVIVFTAGGKPDAAQRARSLERGWRDNPNSPVLVVTDQLLALGVITVFSWFGLNIRAVQPRWVEEAYVRLELTAEERAWVALERRRIDAQLDQS
jgi:hypothetical protein